jgi:septum formation protein
MIPDRGMAMDGIRLILASASPRRAELLRKHGYDFRIIEPPHQEPSYEDDNLTPAQHAEALSHFKAASVAPRLLEGWVLGADTLTVLGGEVFGKPKDRADARRILQLLGGTIHQVITGVTLLDAPSRRRLIRHDITAVTMRALSAAQLETYLDSNEWQGKAGAYGIQDSADEFVDHIKGSFTNVVGLPMELLDEMLREFGRTEARR